MCQLTHLKTPKENKLRMRREGSADILALTAALRVRHWGYSFKKKSIHKDCIVRHTF